MKNKIEKKKKKTGNILRIISSLPMLILFLFQLLFIIMGLIQGGSVESSEFIVFTICASVFLIISIFLLICIHQAKYHKWCNNVFLILGILFVLCGCFFIGLGIYFIIPSSHMFDINNPDTYVTLIAFGVGILVIPFGVCSIIGANRGKKWIPVFVEERKQREELAKQKKAEAALRKEQTLQVQPNINSDGIANAQVVDSKTLKKRSLISWICFGVVVAYYLFLMIIGILGIAMPEKGILWSIEDPISGPVDNYLSGFICLLFLPSVCYYLAFKGPFNLKNLVRYILIGSGVLVALIGIILYLCLLGDYFLICSSSATMKIVPILSNVGLIAIYALSVIRINPDKIKKVDYSDDKSDTGLKALLVRFIHWVTNLGKALLRNRTTATFAATGTLLFTICVFELVELLYVLLGLVVCLVVIGVGLMLYQPTKHLEYRVAGSNGNLVTLKYKTYDSFRSCDVYEDEFGFEWETRDGGSTFAERPHYRTTFNDNELGEKKESYTNMFD